MRIKTLVTILILSIFNYNCANTGTGNNNTTEYMEILFNYHTSSDVITRKDLQIPKDTKKINISEKITMFFKSPAYEENYIVKISSGSTEPNIVEIPIVINDEGDNLVQVINKNDNSIVQSFTIAYQP